VCDRGAVRAGWNVDPDSVFPSSWDTELPGHFRRGTGIIRAHIGVVTDAVTVGPFGGIGRERVTAVHDTIAIQVDVRAGGGREYADVGFGQHAGIEPYLIHLAQVVPFRRCDGRRWKCWPDFEASGQAHGAAHPEPDRYKEHREGGTREQVKQPAAKGRYDKPRDCGAWVRCSFLLNAD